VWSFVSYYLFLIFGQGAFPILFFSGVCVVLYVAHNRVSDPWMRVVGLLLLSIAFAAAVHHIQPGSENGLPEGQGGILGIGAATFLQAHFSTAGTRLVLMTAMLIGLILVADDLVLKVPMVVGAALSHAKLPKADFKLTIPSLNRKSTDGEKTGPIQRLTKPDEDVDELKSSVLLKFLKGKLKSEPDVVLNYHNDEPAPAATVPAHVDADPGPAVAVVVPPPAPAPATSTAPATTLFVDPVPAMPEASIEDAIPAVPSGPAIEPPKVRNEIIVKLPSMVKARQVSPPTPPPRELGEYHLPSWECLCEAEHGYVESQEAFVREKAAVLEQALREFNVDAHVVEIDTGPVITMYELSLAPGLKVSAITSLTNDIMRALKAESVRIVAPVPGKNTVGIEVPNEQKEKVRFKELLQLAPDAMAKDFMIPLFLGKDASGEPLITDLVRMPHCLIAGTTGSGKSVCINTIIMSIMYLQRPDRVKLILVDPKVVEMAPFKDIPHLMCPVINDTGRATSVLEWACEKMDERYEFLAEAGVRNIKDYNTMTQEELIERFQPGSPEEEAKIPKHLPYIIIIIDELADLMMTSGKEVESFIVRLAQKSRAVGIHLILATQRPAATVVTGLIKSNMPDGQPNRHGPERRGIAAGPGRHALHAPRREQTDPQPGHLHRRQGNPRQRQARQRPRRRPVRTGTGADQGHRQRRRRDGKGRIVRRCGADRAGNQTWQRLAAATAIDHRLQPSIKTDRTDGRHRHRRRLQRLAGSRGDVHAGRMGRDESPAAGGRGQRDDGVEKPEIRSPKSESRSPKSEIRTNDE
jgi:S-DNA-T family DNA segregation ATPase FtsK/SpoIIIE